MFERYDIIALISNLVALGVNLTEKQTLTLKWRLSDEGKKCYSRKETNEFYKAVRTGNTDVIDTIRKEKQQRINELKKKLRLMQLIVFASILTTLVGCSTIIETPDRLDTGALKTDELSYAIKDVAVYSYKDKKTIDFEGEWFVVHPDYIKEHVENQDDLIKSFESQILLTRILMFLIPLCVLAVIMCVVLLIVIKKH